MRATTIGALLVIVYTGMMATADGITKFIAGGYTAPQLFALSSALVVIMAAGASRMPHGGTLKIINVKAMFARSVLTVIAAVAFFLRLSYCCHLPMCFYSLD